MNGGQIGLILALLIAAILALWAWLPELYGLRDLGLTVLAFAAIPLAGWLARR